MSLKRRIGLSFLILSTTCIGLTSCSGGVLRSGSVAAPISKSAAFDPLQDLEVRREFGVLAAVQSALLGAEREYEEKTMKVEYIPAYKIAVDSYNQADHDWNTYGLAVEVRGDLGWAKRRFVRSTEAAVVMLGEFNKVRGIHP